MSNYPIASSAIVRCRSKNSRAEGAPSSPVRQLLACVISLSLLCIVAAAEDGAKAWLRYAPLNREFARNYDSLPASVVTLGDSVVMTSARRELITGIKGLLGRTLRESKHLPGEPAIVIGTAQQVRALGVTLQGEPAADSYTLTTSEIRGQKVVIISGASDRGVLYGVFAFLREIAQGKNVESINETRAPAAPIRWVNQWDNLDGSMERGYAGRSIFFENRRVKDDLTRASEYARLLASVGINGCNVSNVNADLHILDPDFIPQLARIADAFRPYGVRLGVAVNVSMPKQVGGLQTFDPLDPSVAKWWQDKFIDVYRLIPDFGGVVVKADSEGQLGPSVYGRSAAEAANVIAKALKPHGGVVFYRAFVYNHHLDWNDHKADRARAAYDIFHPLDGKFDDNVIVQIKHGPIDFQVREPASPLFGGLEKTNEAIELQITQEYLGQQRHTVYIVPMWQEVLNFDMRVQGKHTPVKEIVAGKSFGRPTGGYVGVANVGLQDNWLGNHLALANLYGFGRLAWNPELSSKAIVDEWTRLTFGNDRQVVQRIGDIQMESWPTYESYTGVLGLQTLTNITGPHYGPAPESQERNGWGQWIRAEHDGVGMDRTVATGTGYVGQYSPQVQKLYETSESTPEDLLLFFHHVPYTYRLRNGKTVIQTIYDRHYEGADKAREFVARWTSLRSHIDDDRYWSVLKQLTYQAEHAIVWRDAINDWFARVSGVADEKGRVGHHPNRVEAESMSLHGYEAFEPKSWESASGAKAVTCGERASSCSAQTRFDGRAGWYELDVQYFDLDSGSSQFRVSVNDQVVDQWIAGEHLPGSAESADSSVRRRIVGIALRPGDVIRIEGIPDGVDRASLDYLEVVPETK